MKYIGEVKRKMDKKRFLKEASVLLLAIIMIFSSSVAIANTKSSLSNNLEVNTQNNSPLNQILIWDNTVGVHGGDGGIFVATERSDGFSDTADDFQLDTSEEVNSIFWQGGYFQCELAQGFMDYEWDWRVIFWDTSAEGWHPGTEIHNWTIANTSITVDPWYEWTNTSTGREYWVANYSAQLPETVTFAANTKYWITVRGIGDYPPQACWVRHNGTAGGIKLHEAVFRGALWGFPNWVNLSEVISTEKIPHDLNFQLYGPEVQNNPPEEPSIEGKTTKLKPDVDYDYTLNADDPDTDDVYYYVDWGDGNNSGWVGPSGSGIDVILNHTWTESKTYTVKAKARDIYYAESDWTTITVTVPRAKAVNNLLQKILMRFPNAFPILRHLLL